MNFFPCVCGRLHSYGSVSQDSVCTCGENLYVQINPIAAAKKAVAELAERQGKC